MAYHSLDEWLSEIENLATRGERLGDEIRDGTVKAVMPWIEAAWRLGGEAERWAIECNKDMAEAAKSNIRELLTAQGVPTAAFIDDHVANAIAQRNILAKCLLNLRVDAPAHAVAAIDDAIAKVYPSGTELRALGDAVVRHLRALADDGKAEGRE